ncbi:neuropeptide FF receptor 1-like [Oncorhynchus masou masou]|uniref:neuropeptide FF receptor 1-like n=1 Tax=Oncorhynchus masou masou TaxID=90313 RepID=UPI0031843B1D
MEDTLELQLTTTHYMTSDLILSSNLTNLTDCTNTNSSCTVSSVKLSPYYQHSLAIAASFTLAYLFIFMPCMVGNCLVCLIVVKNRHMRTVTNLFILNLAISDLLVGIFCIPTTLVDNLITGWPFSNAVCKLSGLVQGISVAASVFTLVAIAVDRFRCIVYPFKPKLTLLVAKATIGLVWALALVIMLPSAVMLTVDQEKGHFMVSSDNKIYPLYYCYETWPDPEMRKVYTMVLFTHIYLMPLALIMIMYGCIGAKLSATAVLSNSGHPDIKSPISQRKVKVVKMLIVVALLFMLSWLPLWTLMLLTDYARPEGDQLDILTGYIFPFSHWLAFSNSSINPIIYGYFNENFKKGFQAACRPGSCCSVVPQEQAVSKDHQGCKARTTRDTALSANPLTIRGVRNRIHTDSDLTGCVCLEMEQRKAECSAEAGGWRGSEAEGSNSNGGVSIKRGVHAEDVDGLSPMGVAVCQAWEH